MSAAWLLDKAHTVTVFEKEPWTGGHSHTVDAPLPGGSIPVDTGFIVYNERNYPNLTALFAHLDVPTSESEMSFAASLDGGRFEYAGTDLNGLLGQRSNVFRRRFWRMLADILRFYRQAPKSLAAQLDPEISLGAFLKAEGYDDSFVHDHLLPMGAAIWSTTAEAVLAYPAAAFVRFFENHGLLNVTNRPQWRTVAGGSREYVQRLTEPYRHRIRHTGVQSLRRGPNGVQVTDCSGHSEMFDHAMIATHADQALTLFEDADTQESRLLGDWRYSRNRVVLHRDPSLMPKRRRVWSSWNFLGGDTRSGQADGGALCVTYWMNRLQPLPTAENLFVTLNPVREPAPGSIIDEYDYTHPLFDAAALASQRELWSLQGHRRTWYCGSYFGSGFHEDALQSGLAAAEQLGGVKRPWSVAGENARITMVTAEQEAAA